MTLAYDDPRHGTTNGYSNLGCRCDLCRRAWAEYVTEKNHRLGRAVPLAEYRASRTRTHGLSSTYAGGCRCAPCTKAATDKRTLRRAVGTVTIHSANGYKNGCRCEVCRTAYREYNRERGRAGEAQP